WLRRSPPPAAPRFPYTTLFRSGARSRSSASRSSGIAARNPRGTSAYSARSPTRASRGTQRTAESPIPIVSACKTAKCCGASRSRPTTGSTNPKGSPPRGCSSASSSSCAALAAAARISRSAFTRGSSRLRAGSLRSRSSSTGSSTRSESRSCRSATCCARRRPLHPSPPPLMASVQSITRAGEPGGAARVPCVDFVGIGVQKAGTTWLHRMLSAHPDVFMAQADDKDLRFFNAFYDRGYLWYERHFATTRAQRRGEFSTSYFYSKDAPERVYRYNPKMRLLLSLRDPVARLISHHRHEIRLGRIAHDLPLERAIESNPSYVEQSRYFTQLSRWLEWFPLSSFHVVIFEEMFEDAARTVRDLYAFVGVS